jgi:hypothetical protein
MGSRAAISNKIKRSVRQRCGFGCVICGVPIYEYDHIPGYANVKRHKANELTLLCPNHHALKTKGLLSNEDVIDANAKPFNLVTGASSPFSLSFSGDSPVITISELTFMCTGSDKPRYLIPIMVNRHALFGFTIVEGGLLLNMEVRDSSGRKVLKIKDSQLVISTCAWDATIIGRRIIIKEALRHSIVELELVPPNKFILHKYKISSGGITVTIDENYISFTGTQITNTRLVGDGSFDANICILAGESPSKNMSIGLKL